MPVNIIDQILAIPGPLIYAGIGSRRTPPDVCQSMTTIAAVLYNMGFTLRSGGAHRADQAFERGAGDRKEIFRPNDVEGRPDAYELAARFHPAWSRCSPIAKDLHARNGFQILGRDLRSPVRCVVCWTPDGQASGGTGQALRIAAHYGIMILNLRCR